MTHTYFIVAAILVTLATIVVVALLLWRRFTLTPPTTPPISTEPSALAAPLSRYTLEDEWEAQAPYPDHAVHAIRGNERIFRDASPHKTHYRLHDRFTFDDIEPFEPDELPSFHRPFQQPATDTDFFSYGPPDARISTTSSSSDAAQRCPHCNSSRITTLNIGRKAGSTIGSVAGATSGMAMTLSGAEAGAVVGAIGGPLGSVFGGLAGAVIAGLLGSAAGCAAGSAVGAAIDENVLDNYRCLSCGHTFSAQHD